MCKNQHEIEIRTAINNAVICKQSHIAQYEERLDQISKGLVNGDGCSEINAINSLEDDIKELETLHTKVIDIFWNIDAKKN